MKYFQHSRVVALPAKQLYTIITDIEAYPHIINHCHHATVISRTPLPNGSESVEASLSLKLGPLKRTFTSHNIHTPCSRVEVALKHGDLRNLSGVWALNTIDAIHCEVDCNFTFSLGNSALDALAEKFLHGYIKHSIESSIAYAERQYHKSRNLLD